MSKKNEHFHGPVKGLTNAYRSSSRWHTRTWAHAVIREVESDAAKRFDGRALRIGGTARELKCNV